MTSKPESITTLLVDDHFVVRSGLAASLNLEADISVVGEADSGEEAVDLYRETSPTVVLLDLQLPGMNGIETAEQLRSIDPDARILIFSSFARDDEVQSALRAGALGYLQKTAHRDELIDALWTVSSGEPFLPPDMADRLSEWSHGPAITMRERDILERIALGMANKEIGAELGIAEDTVKRHVSNVLQKLEVNDRAQATAEAIRRGIIRV